MSQIGVAEFMRTTYENSLEYQVEKRLNALSTVVILRKDIEDLGSYRQISRVLSRLVEDKKLIKLGMGIYAKAYMSKYSDRPLVQGGADTAFRIALKRLGVNFEAGSSERAYNAGESTQVPVRNIVKLKSRCRRQFTYGKNKLIFEKNINAR